MYRQIRQVQVFFLVAFVGLAAGLVYWQLIRAEGLLSRGNNPRPIIAELRIRRGAIYASDGTLLAETTLDAGGLAQRHYPHPAAAPLVGYYSLRYGTAGLEAAFDGVLRGQPRLEGVSNAPWLANLMHRPSEGDSITTTLHLPGQQMAVEALANWAETGAAVVMNARTGEVLVMASYPTFDPNTLESERDALIEDPRAPLLNRVTQGLFPSGDLVRLVGLIGLAETNRPIPAQPLTLPLADLLKPLPPPEFLETARNLGLDRDIDFALPTVAGTMPGSWPDRAAELGTTPLHVALIGSALMQGGLAPMPSLIAGATPSRHRLMRAETAAAAGPIVGDFSALALPDVTGNQPLSWYLGLFDGEPPLVIVVVATTSEVDADAARQIGEQILAAGG